MTTISNIIGTVAVAAVVSMTTTFSIANASSHVGLVQTFKNVKTGRCIDDSTNLGLRASDCYGNSHQKWDVSGATGAKILKNMNTGRCLDDSTNLGLRASDCYGNDHQKWQ